MTTRCDGCITVHTAEALKHGATREEIAEALGVAVALLFGCSAIEERRWPERQLSDDCKLVYKLDEVEVLCTIKR